MAIVGKLKNRLPCQSIPRKQLGPYEILGILEGGVRTEAFISQSYGNAEELLLLRQLRKDQDAKGFLRDIDRTHQFSSSYLRTHQLELEGQLFSKSKPFVSEPLSLLLTEGFNPGTCLPLPVALSIAHGIFQRLTHHEAQGGVHGDLAPHHVLIGYDGRIVLIDPAGPEDGISRSKLSSRQHYRSPEHIKNCGLSIASDVFSAGILLYEMTTGESMFGRRDESIETHILTGKYRRPRSLMGRNYPIELQVILRKMLSADVEQRFNSARDALNGLDLISGPNKTEHAHIIQAFMHKAFPRHYSGWKAVFESGGVQLPPSEITEPRGTTHRPESPSHLSAPNRPALRNDTYVSEERRHLKTEPIPVERADDESSSDSKIVSPRDVSLPLGEEPTHIATILPQLQQTSVKQPATKRPPLLIKVNTSVDGPDELTSPGRTPPTTSWADTKLSAEFTTSEPTPTPILFPEAKLLEKERPLRAQTEPETKLNRFIPSVDVQSQNERIVEQNSQFPYLSEPALEITADEEEDLQILVDTSNLSIEENNEFPLNQEEIDHLQIAADLLDQNPQVTDRSDINTRTPTPCEGPISLDEDFEITGDPSPDHTSPAEIAIPRPRKLSAHSESDWAQSLIEGESSDRMKMPLAPVRPRPLHRLTRHSIIQAQPRKLLAEDGNGELALAKKTLDHEPAQILGDQIISSASEARPTLAPQTDELLDNPAISEALVLPISDTSLNREYLRQKRLVRIGFTGVGVLLVVILFLILDIIDHRNGEKPEVNKTVPAVTEKTQESGQDTPEQPKPSTTSKPPAHRDLTAPKLVDPAGAHGGGKKAPTVSYQISVQVFPNKKAQILVDDREIKNGSTVEIFDKTLKLVIKAPGYKTHRETLSVGRTEPVEVLLTRVR